MLRHHIFRYNAGINHLDRLQYFTDYNWGSFVNGSWNGVVGSVLRRVS